MTRLLELAELELPLHLLRVLCTHLAEHAEFWIVRRVALVTADGPAPLGSKACLTGK